MTLRQNLSLLILLFGFCAYAQKPETVFVTQPSPDGKTGKNFPFFSQFAVALPIKAAPENSTTEDSDSNSVLDYIVPDGLSAHFGGGVHLDNWVGVGLNGGIDWVGSSKLVVAPLYGSVFLNPYISGETSLLIQAGYGYAFALGRGDLSGTYQKYRLGIVNDDSLGFFIEVNQYQFPIYDLNPAGSITLGVTLFDFW